MTALTRWVHRAVSNTSSLANPAEELRYPMFPPRLQRVLAATRLACLYKSGAPEADGGPALRPIGVPTTLRKVLEGVVVARNRMRIQALMDPIQVGCGTRSGCERLFHRIEATLSASPDQAVLSVDLANAFNRVSRPVLRRVIHALAPDLLKVFDIVHGVNGGATGPGGDSLPVLTALWTAPDVSVDTARAVAPGPIWARAIRGGPTSRRKRASGADSTPSSESSSATEWSAHDSDSEGPPPDRVIEAETGVTQGAPLSGVYQALALLPVLLTLQGRAKESVWSAYLDDMPVTGPPEELAELWPLAVELLHETGSRVRPDKSQAYSPAWSHRVAIDPLVPPALRPMVRREGLSLFSAPLGDENFVATAMTQTAADIGDRFRAIRGLPADMAQAKSLLLRFCACSMPNYVLRMLPPAVAGVVATATDDETALSLEDLVGSLGSTGSQRSRTLLQASLPLPLGGMAIGNARRVSPAAHIASWVDTLLAAQLVDVGLDAGGDAASVHGDLVRPHVAPLVHLLADLRQRAERHHPSYAVAEDAAKAEWYADHSAQSMGLPGWTAAHIEAKLHKSMADLRLAAMDNPHDGDTWAIRPGSPAWWAHADWRVLMPDPRQGARRPGSTAPGAPSHDPFPRTGSLQHALALELHQSRWSVWEAGTTDEASVMDRARRRHLSHRWAGRWLTAVPVTSQLTISAEEFRRALRYHLGLAQADLDSPVGLTCTCSPGSVARSLPDTPMVNADPLGIHAVRRCPFNAGIRTARHHNIVRLVAAALTATGWRDVVREPRVRLPNRQMLVADLVATEPSATNDLMAGQHYTDVTVVHPPTLTPFARHGRAFDIEAPLRLAAEAKQTKYAPLMAHVRTRPMADGSVQVLPHRVNDRFEPLVFSALGQLSTSTAKWLRSALAEEPQRLALLYISLSVALVRGVAGCLTAAAARARVRASSSGAPPVPYYGGPRLPGHLRPTRVPSGVPRAGVARATQQRQANTRRRLRSSAPAQETVTSSRARVAAMTAPTPQETVGQPAAVSRFPPPAPGAIPASPPRTFARPSWPVTPSPHRVSSSSSADDVPVVAPSSVEREATTNPPARGEEPDIPLDIPTPPLSPGEFYSTTPPSAPPPASSARDAPPPLSSTGDAVTLPFTVDLTTPPRSPRASRRPLWAAHAPTLPVLPLLTPDTGPPPEAAPPGLVPVRPPQPSSSSPSAVVPPTSATDRVTAPAHPRAARPLRP
ncbi:hypothetical protein MMPV_008855 [Pyropia vietnamensis]